MFGTISIKLTNIIVSGYFPPPLSIQEPLITDGTGTLTISFYPPPPFPFPTPPTPVPQPEPLLSSAGGLPIVWRGIRYYLQVSDGTRVNALRLGQMVTVTAFDDEKKVLQLATQLETIDAGTPAIFAGPVGVHLPPTPAS